MSKTKQRKVINNVLTLKQVKRIKFVEKHGNKTAREVAAKYEVHMQTIYKIWDNTNWAWVNQ